MANTTFDKIKHTQSMQDTDFIVVVVDGKEHLISKENFSKIISLLTTEQKNKLTAIILSGDGSKILTDSGVYKSLNTMFSQAQFNLNDSTKLLEINGYHTHSNSELLDKFSVNGDTLLFDGSALSSYILPTATENSIGGVKVDGITITVSEDGTISGANNFELPTATNTVLGGVKIDGDTIKINDGVISADVIGNWASGITYPVGYFVVYNNTLYQCIKANSDTEWNDNNWNLIAGGNNSVNITEWKNNIDYSVNDLVIYENTLYRCTETHTSVSEFDTTKWIGLSGTKGDKGEDGISPTFNTTAVENGIKISVTDINGTSDFDILNGQDGKDGLNGVDGKSAYDIAINNNFVGSEQDWLESLKGTDGNTPSIDPVSKCWKIGEKDTGVIAEGRITVNVDCAVVHATFLAENWSEEFPYTQTVVVPNITENNVPIVDVSLSDDNSLWEDEENAFLNLMRVETNNGSIVGYCLNKPNNNFKIKMRIAGEN